MSTELEKYKPPTLAELVADKEMMFANDSLNVILNTPVPKSWIKEHPFAKIKVGAFNPDGTPQLSTQTGKQLTKEIQLPYVPVKRVMHTAKRIYGTVEWSIKSAFQCLNAFVVTGTITITNPVTGLKESNDGIGAAMIQMDAGATQGDLTAIKPVAIQLAAPAAESYAKKNAMEKFGAIFGGNIYDVDGIGNEAAFSENVRKTYSPGPKQD